MHSAIPASPNPLVTVITPAFNAQAFVDEAIESVLNQSHDRVEYIVVDNGSTDRTREICSNRLAGVPYGKVVNAERRGPSAARNVALRQATGEFISFLDADDVWEPRMIERCLDAIRAAGPKVAGVFCHSFLMLSDGKVVGKLGPRPGLYDLGHWLEGAYPPGNGSCLLIRSKCFDQAGLFDETLPSASDFEMTARIAAHTDSPFFLCLPEPLARYRLHADSVSGSLSTRLASPDRLAGLDQVLTRYAHLVPEFERRIKAYQGPAVFAFQGGDEKRALEWSRSALASGPRCLTQSPMGRRLLGWLLAGRPGRSAVRVVRRWSLELAVKMLRFPLVATMVRRLRSGP